MLRWSALKAGEHFLFPGGTSEANAKADPEGGRNILDPNPTLKQANQRKVAASCVKSTVEGVGEFFPTGLTRKAVRSYQIRPAAERILRDPVAELLPEALPRNQRDSVKPSINADRTELLNQEGEISILVIRP